jgi:hypothetical protein
MYSFILYKYVQGDSDSVQVSIQDAQSKNIQLRNRERNVDVDNGNKGSALASYSSLYNIDRDNNGGTTQEVCELSIKILKIIDLER